MQCKAAQRLQRPGWGWQESREPLPAAQQDSTFLLVRRAPLRMHWDFYV